MKIQSQFKDYYDHVAYAYGGGDPKVLYLRNRIGTMEHHVTDHIVKGLEIEQKGIPSTGDEELRRKFSVESKWLAINAKLYLIINTVARAYEFPIPPNWHVLSEEKHPDVWAYLHKAHWWARGKTEKYIGVDSPEILELTRKVGAPVFTCEHKSWRNDIIHVDGNVPILATMGIPAMIPAEQLYQDIAYFIGNTIKLSPDTMPATVMTDKEKIAAAGFDLKQSFRHRV